MAYEYRFDNHKLLSIEQEYDLFTEYKETKDIRIRDKIIIHNLKFAMHCATSYIKRFPYVQSADLKGYAIEGLIHAVDEFDHTRGNKFITYAVWWIKQYIVRKVELNESRIRYPANWHRKLQMQINSKNFSDDVLDMCANISGMVSLDSTFNDSPTAGTISDVTTDESVEHSMENMLETERMNHLKEILTESLNEPEREVIYGIFGLNGEESTMAEKAIDMGISVDMVRSHRTNAYTKIARYKARLVK